MWDEKEFFENFIKESEQIQPSSEFVERMKGLSHDAEMVNRKKRTKTPKVITGILAAAAVTGILFLSGVQKVGEGKELRFPGEKIHAGKDEASQGFQGSLGEIVDKNLMFLEKALEDSQILVEKENGSQLTQEEREDLLKKISDAKEIQISLQEYKKQQTYHVKGEEELQFSIVDGKYLLFEGRETVYLLHE